MFDFDNLNECSSYGDHHTKQKYKDQTNKYAVNNAACSQNFSSDINYAVRISALFAAGIIGPFLCKVCHYVGQTSAVVIILCLVASAVAEYHEVCAKLYSVRTTSVLIAALWIAGGLWGIRAPIFNGIFFL